MPKKSQQSSSALKKFISNISAFVSSFLPSDCRRWCESYIDSGDKIIHDSIWGTFRLTPLEIAVLDTPLLQRLRFIKQTGCTYLTYPSARHTRFEHTLGVMCQSDRMLQHLRRQEANPKLITDEVIRNIRLAAILHDVGHGPFSHTSEQYYSVMNALQKIRLSSNPYGDCDAGEMLSALIVTSKPFRKFAKQLYQSFDQEVDVDSIAKLITGKIDPLNYFRTEIIHGPFDADKLDYMHRDGLFSGLGMQIDLDRLMNSMKIHKCKWRGKVQRRLAGSVSGTTPLEQIMFNKMVLHTGIYHHHKVRACDCMLWAVFERAVKTKKKVGGVKLNSPSDFLKLTDDSLMTADLCEDDSARKIIEDIRTRRIWKRALVIARSTIEEECYEAPDKNDPDNEKGPWQEFRNLNGNDPDKFKNRRSIARKIWKKAGEPCAEHEIWLDIPTLPSMQEAKKTWIVLKGNEKPIVLGKIVPIDKWVKQYGIHKYRAHVFCPKDCVDVVSDASSDVLSKEFGLKFKPFAKSFAKIT